MPGCYASRPRSELPLHPEIHSSLRLSETPCPPLNGFWLGLSTAMRDCVSPGSRMADCERKILKRLSPTLETFRKVGVKFLSGFCGFLVQPLCLGKHGH